MKQYSEWMAALVIAALVYLILIAPNFKRRGRNWAGCRFAHRGLHDAHNAENSLAAFERACQAGEGIELDVQLTRDGVPVVFHDPSLLRMCGVDRRLDEVDFADVQKLRLAGTDQMIPTFDEALGLVRGRVPLLVEIKTGRHNIRLCEKTWEQLKNYEGEFIVESFNPLILFWLRRHAPGVIRGLLISNFADVAEAAGKPAAIILSSLLLDSLARPDFLACNIAEPRFHTPARMRALYRPLMAAWTVRDPATADALTEQGEIAIYEGFQP